MNKMRLAGFRELSMGVASPEEMAAAFVDRFNARDEVAMRELYAPDAVLTFDGAEHARGAEEIKLLLHRLMGSPMKVRGQYLSVMAAGDIALCSLRWESLDPEGWIDQDGVSVEVLKRCADGLWRFAIDDVTGASRERD